MKKIIRIARTELSILFYSPIAWIIIILFFIQCGLIFTDLLYSQETNQQLGRPLSVLSKVLFAGEEGILAKVQQYLFLYIPILTMGLFSREISSGSIKLLLSSPITAVQMVFGKFLSMILYCFILALILLSFIITGHFSIIELDIPFVLGGVLGIYLLMCAYAAIGMFMSSLTSYQIVAAISTLAILAGLNYIGTIGQQYDLIRQITYWISISGRADNFVNGLISSKDIIYFLLIICLFLSFTVFKFLNERSSLSQSRKILRYAMAIITVVILGFVSSLPGVNAYYDTTRFKDRTLTKSSQHLIDKLDAPVKITTYVNVLHYSASKGSPENRIEDLKHFEKYRRFIPNMKMNYVYYYDTIPHLKDTTLTLKGNAKKSAKALKFDFEEVLTPEQIQSKIDLKPENNRLVRFINYKNDTTALRMFNDILQYPHEGETSAALKRMIEGPGRVGMLTGQGERAITTNKKTSYKVITKGVNIRGSLMNQGFDVNQVNLENKEIPSNLDVLIIADPKSSFSTAKIKKINQYITSGGNLLIAGEPGRNQNLDPLLEQLGLKFVPGTLLEESEDYEQDLIQAKFTNEAQEFGFGFYKKAIVGAPRATGISIEKKNDFQKTPILVTNKKTTWIKKDSFDLDKEKVVFDPVKEKKVAVPLAVALTRKLKNKTQKIMVLGDADFMSNAEMTRNNLNTVNSSFVIRMFKWFSDGKYPVNTGKPKPIDTKIKLSRAQIEFLKIFYAGIIPIVIGVLAAIILTRRKRN